MATTNFLDAQRNVIIQSGKATTRETTFVDLQRRRIGRELSRRAKRLRTAQVENGWSNRERVARLRGGENASAWLSSLINHSQTE